MRSGKRPPRLSEQVGVLYERERTIVFVKCLFYDNLSAALHCPDGRVLVAKGWQMTSLSLVGFPRTSAKITSYPTGSIAISTYSILEMANYISFPVHCLLGSRLSWTATGLGGGMPRWLNTKILTWVSITGGDS